MIATAVLVRETLVDDVVRTHRSRFGDPFLIPCTGNDTCCSYARSRILCTNRPALPGNCRSFRDPYNCRNDRYKGQCCYYLRRSAHSRQLELRLRAQRQEGTSSTICLWWPTARGTLVLQTSPVNALYEVTRQPISANNQESSPLEIIGAALPRGRSAALQQIIPYLCSSRQLSPTAQ